jgi:hypothetical protein
MMVLRILLSRAFSTLQFRILHVQFLSTTEGKVIRNDIVHESMKTCYRYRSFPTQPRGQQRTFTYMCVSYYIGLKFVHLFLTHLRSKSLYIGLQTDCV